MKEWVYRLSTAAWRLVKGPFQWYFLWFLNDKFMVSVAGVVTRADGSILLLRHRYWTVGTWGLPGGIMKRGETVEAALCREVREETGYEITPEGLLEVHSGYKLRMEVFLRARVTGGSEHLDEREVLEARFFAPDALPEGVLESQAAVIAQAAQPVRTGS